MSEWNGEGLPPVGTRCRHQSSPQEGIIVAHVTDDGTTSAIIQYADRWACSYHGFVPIRSERQMAIDEIQEIVKKHKFDTISGMAHALYDAGYRKTK
jgi:hypothetical protein